MCSQPPVRQSLAPTTPAHQRIIKSALWITFFVLLGKLAGAAKEMSLAWRYGVSEITDAYQLANSLALWLPSALVTTLTAVVVPVFVRLRIEKDTERKLFLAELQGSILLVGVALSLLGGLAAPAALPYIAGQLSAISREMALNFTFGMLPLAPLTLLASIYASRLMAEGRQLNTLLESVPALTILMFVLMWPSKQSIMPLLLGTLVGVFFHVFLLFLATRRLVGETGSFLFSRRSRHWGGFHKAAGIMVVGQFIMSFIVPLDQYTAAQLGDGGIATLGYANRVVSLLSGIGAIAIARASLPVLSELYAAGKVAEQRKMSLKWTLLMLVAGSIVAAVAWILAPWGISVLFERGEFGPAETLRVVEVFRWGLVQLPFYYGGLVMVQLLVSEGRYGIIALFAASNLVIKFFLNLVLSKFMGVSGVALATGLMYVWSAGCLCYAAMHVPLKGKAL